MAPTVSLSVDIDITKLNEIRIKQKKKITLTQVLLSVICKNIIDYKILFACFNGKKIVHNSKLLLNVPVDIENHVEYVILKNPDKYSLDELADDFNNQIDKIKAGEGAFKKELEKIMRIPKPIRKFLIKIPGVEIKFINKNYGNFVVTNIGTLGMKSGTMTIMRPVISSLIVSMIQKNNSKEILPITLWFDHRAADAGYASRFLSSVKKQMESPEAIFTS